MPLQSSSGIQQDHTALLPSSWQLVQTELDWSTAWTICSASSCEASRTGSICGSRKRRFYKQGCPEWTFSFFSS